MTDKGHSVPKWVHFLSGGLGGMVAVIVTCPLEVVKTRMQSSQYQYRNLSGLFTVTAAPGSIAPSSSVVSFLRTRSQTVAALSHIAHQEGWRALWRGIGPNLIGVIPARSIYFMSYSWAKPIVTALNRDRETPLVHMLSAGIAGFSVATATNPIWLVKTRIQLQQSQGGGKGAAQQYAPPRDTRGVGLWEYMRNSHTIACIRDVYRRDGLVGFYRGLSASYFGISETMLQFAIYEQFKSFLKRYEGDESTLTVAIRSLMSASGAKLLASVSVYPHEVARTRLRESPGDGPRKYTGFVQTLKLVLKEEGVRGLYAGMPAHLMRVVPNAAILFLTYEVSVSLYQKHTTTTQDPRHHPQ